MGVEECGIWQLMNKNLFPMNCLISGVDVSHTLCSVDEPDAVYEVNLL